MCLAVYSGPQWRQARSLTRRGQMTALSTRRGLNLADSSDLQYTYCYPGEPWVNTTYRHLVKECVDLRFGKMLLHIRWQRIRDVRILLYRIVNAKQTKKPKQESRVCNSMVYNLHIGTCDIHVPLHIHPIVEGFEKTVPC